jgi:hypothetical protein
MDMAVDMAALLDGVAAIFFNRALRELRLLRSNLPAMSQCNRHVLSKVSRAFALASVAVGGACR